MDSTILLGYAAGIITMAALAKYPENFRPTVTEQPMDYVIAGVVLGTVAVALDLIGVWF